MSCSSSILTLTTPSISHPNFLKPARPQAHRSITERTTTFDITPLTSFPPIKEPTNLQRLSKEPLFILGAHLAILLQWANPSLALGSYHRSRFANHPLSRLKRTSIFMTAAVYGTPSELAAIYSMINKQHANVRGKGYDANDVELQKWTAATLCVALVVVHETFLGSIPLKEEEALCAESSCFATSLKMPGEMWPKSLDEFYTYWDTNINNLTITPEARKLRQLLTHNKNFPWYMRCAMPVIMMLTAKWLPRRLRREYGLPDPDTRVRRLLYEVVVLVVRWCYWCVPGWIKEGWHEGNLRDMREVVGEVRRSGRWPV